MNKQEYFTNTINNLILYAKIQEIIIIKIRGGRMNKQEAIDQLKESLSKMIENIEDENDFNKGYRYATQHCFDIIKQIDEPQKVVVPKFVREWVDDSRECCFNFDEWFDCGNQLPKVYDWLNSENKRQAELNALALVTLIVNGANAVEIEPDKLYTVEIPNPNAKDVYNYFLKKESSTGKVVLFKKSVNPRNNKDLWLTESEIKDDFEWAWQFAEEVEK